MATLLFLLLAVFRLVQPAQVVAADPTNDPPTIDYHELAADLFTDKGTSSFSELLFDVGREQVVVGARDALFRLSLRGLARLEKASWYAPVEKSNLCQDKGQPENACHNYIKVLVSNGRRLFTCGTNAFSPQCTWREMENVNSVLEKVPGLGKCPPNPRTNSTALLSSTGHFYVASTIDFSGTDAALVRSFAPAPLLRSSQYDSKWFNDPQFVGSFETDSHFYFVFRENAVEHMNCGKAVYSRIGRICKNDAGGSVILKDSWMTFIKARLNCSLPGEFPFYFSEIQDMALVENQKVLYATFNTNRNSIPATAVCAFNMTSILAAFAGPFKYQGHSSQAWEAQTSPLATRHFDCEKIPPDPRMNHNMQDSSRYQLMDSAVQPTRMLPLYHRRLEFLSLIAVDVVPTKHHPGVHVVYTSTEDGVIRKMSVLPGSQDTCVLELWRPFTDKMPPRYRKMQFLRETESLYIGTEQGVLRIPGQHCGRYKTRTTCLAAMDPYCGWNELKEACTPAPNRDPSSGHWQQNALKCPDRSTRMEIVDGGWSAWSAWSPCPMDGGDADTNCLCRTRRCDHPAPANGGMPCHGETTAVTNCTVHGGWTAWSAWSACSQTCGLAVKTRKRTCGNPAPQHGGRICVGEDRSEIYCTSNPPCPAKLPPPQDGGWGQWTPWGECSSPCGGGYRVRRRVCDNPIPANGGAECQGCPMDYEPCNNHPCPESRKLSAWTPWLSEAAPGPGNGNWGGTWTEKRFRFSCRAQTADPATIRVTQSKEEKRVCSATTGCKSDRVDSDEVWWSDWSEWSACSAECGGGFQTRTRTCEGHSEDCEGSPKMSRPCNMQRCKGEWSCWSEWSACSVSCGSGMRQRTRHCLSLSNKETLGVNCEGPALSQEPCESPSCESLVGWSTWSVWSECDENADQHRRRTCVTPGPNSCQGHDFETRMCVGGVPNGIDIIPAQALDSNRPGYLSVWAVLGCCFAGFMSGLLCAAAVWYYHKRKRIPHIPSSPCYMSTKQNPYVTVPLKETISQKPKRTASFSSATSNVSHKPVVNCNSLNHPAPKLFSKPADYDSATIKRNSHSLNGNVRPDLEQEKFY